MRNYNGEYYLYIHTKDDDQLQMHVKSFGYDADTIEGFEVVDVPCKRLLKAVKGGTFEAGDLYFMDSAAYVLVDL